MVSALVSTLPIPQTVFVGGFMTSPLPYRRAVAIDDTKVMQAVIAHALTNAGFDTRTASDGYAGWMLIEQFEPDLVITDLDMPLWGGWQLIEAVRHTSNPKIGSVPIIVCSATDDPLAIREAFDAGASYFVSKPIDVRKLVDLFEVIFTEHWV